MSQVPSGICTYCERQAELPCLQEVYDNDSRPLMIRICQGCRLDLDDYTNTVNEAMAELQAKMAARKAKA